ncbi:MAG TPA: lysophospholipid acyltransferase family protein, partial [Chthoniobacterales bacterium]|nr:lysophospholipid acyltransferase family protein [Chthoniobacterales bacterium]
IAMRRLQAVNALELEAAFVQRLRRRSGESNPLVLVLRAVAALILRAWLRIYHRFEITGRERFRTNRALVIVANHCSHLDTLCLLAALPLPKLHRAFPAAATDYFFQSVPRTWMAAMINALPFGRKNHVRRSLSICSQVINEPGNILIIFPEGTRSTTGEMQDFKLGIGALVADRDISVVPCYLKGTFEAWPKRRRLPRPRKIRLIVGESRSYVGRGVNRFELSAIVTELQSAVEQLGTTK